MKTPGKRTQLSLFFPKLICECDFVRNFRYTQYRNLRFLNNKTLLIQLIFLFYCEIYEFPKHEVPNFKNAISRNLFLDKFVPGVFKYHTRLTLPSLNIKKIKTCLFGFYIPTYKTSGSTLFFGIMFVVIELSPFWNTRYTNYT